MTDLNRRVEELLYENAPDFRIAKVIKEDLRESFKTLPDLFAETGGKDFLLRHTRRIDSVIKLAYKVVLRESFGQYTPLRNHVPITLAALGSYGREQLCIHSDIDLMIVYQETPGYNTQEMIEKILYLLWDSGLKLGHRVHELQELPEIVREDITIETAILESRFIDGSRILWTLVENKINEIRKANPERFIREKMEERRRLHRRYSLTMEPNLKEGIGGFRDANMVYWMGKLLYNIDRIRDLDEAIVDPTDYREFRMALEFLFRVRSALHIVAGKKVDQLRLDLLPEVARLLKFEESYRGQLRLARRVTASLKSIHLYSRIWIERLIGSRVPDLYADYLLPVHEHHTLHRLIDELRGHADAPYHPHPHLLHTLIHAERPERPDEVLYRATERIFHRPYAHSVLETLSEARLLGYLIPPMKKVIDLPQFDGYHRYAVDRHSLETLRHMEHIEDGLIAELYEGLEAKERVMLKIVALLHDAGKGRKRDHHEVGASLFRIYARKLGLDPTLIAQGELLIRHHTLMSVTAQREDIYSEKVVLQFTSRFADRKLLDMIYILTYADMKGVGTEVYNDYSAKLLRALYRESVEALKMEHQLDETSKRLVAVDRLKRSKRFRELPKSLQKKILSIPSNAFFIRHSTKRIVAIAQVAAKTEEYNYHLSNERYLTIEVIRRRDFNLALLLAKLSRLQVVSMEITKLFDGLKYFKIDFNERVDESELPLVESMIHEAFEEKAELELKIPTILPEEVSVDCDHSREYAMMKLRTADQPGLIAYLILLFDRFGIDIASAKIHTIKGRVNDLFLIEKNGNFCHNIAKITQKLTEKN
ncbi:[protein-PII] uridylyltransferase family protein [Nitratifractor sp.]